MKAEILEQIRQLVPGNYIKEQEPMKKHTTFRVGGPATCFVEVPDTKCLGKLLSLLTQSKTAFFLLGNGSNLLVSDEGYDGVILKLSSNFAKVTVQNETLTAGAGALLSQVAAVALQAELTGFEFAAGIPGTVGGAMVMNAGAYDGEMKQVVESVVLMDETGNLETLSCDAMQFAYRDSILKHEKKIVVETVFLLQKGEKESISDKMNDFSSRRREKQPLEYPSAGSTFKRPEGYFAGKLIMDAGLRGYRVGDAQVSEKHCGFVINRGNATAADIWQLMMDVQKKVKEQYDVMLEPEVIRLGRF